jgi:hypothetical protein
MCCTVATRLLASAKYLRSAAVFGAERLLSAKGVQFVCGAFTGQQHTSSPHTTSTSRPYPLPWSPPGSALRWLDTAAIIDLRICHMGVRGSGYLFKRDLI